MSHWQSAPPGPSAQVYVQVFFNAYAAKELSIKKIPVIDFRKMHETHKYP